MKIPILDCDNTLYRSDEMFVLISKRIVEFMRVNLGYKGYDEVHEIRKKYLRSYGTTLSGLIRHTNVEPSEYLDYIHDFNLKEFVKPNPIVRDHLSKIPSKKVIMSNAPKKHVLDVLEILNITDIPDKVYSIEDFNYNGKPFKSSYIKVLDELNILPDNAIMVDDSEQNLVGANGVGLKTCLVGKPNTNGFDYQIDDISEILKVFK